MTLQRFVLAIIFSTASLTLASVATAQLPFPTTSVRVGFHPELNTFEIVGVSFYLGRMIAPDGTIFGDANYRPDDVVAGLTVNDLVSRFAGKWSLVQALTAPRWEYEFNVTAEQLVATVQAPEILSPANGARLAPIFNIVHTGKGRVVSGKTATGNGRFESTSNGGHVDESDHLRRDYPLSVTGWAFNSNEVVIGPATQVGGATVDTIVSVVNSTYSTPRNWTINVPEPASLSMVTVGAIALAALRRRK